MTPAPEVENELYRLLDALLDEQMTPDQQQRLEHLVTSDVAVTQLYLEIMHEWGSLPLHVAPLSLSLNESEQGSAPENALEETMILPAVCETDFEQIEEELAPPPLRLPIAQPGKLRRWGGGAAALLIIGLATTWLLLSNPRRVPNIVESVQTTAPSEFPVKVTATAAIDTDIAAIAPPGAGLNAGQFVQLTTGAMELTFGSGAVVVVKAPARFHAIDHNSVALESGELTAHVPVNARGFRVIAPGLWVVDRGTNFGVRARSDSAASEVHVFDGIVDVAGTDGLGQVISDTVRITAGQALKTSALAASAPIAIPYDGQSFSRDINQARIRVPLHDTGEHVTANQSDPNWQVIAVPNDGNWQPRPAKVISDFPANYGDNYLRDKSPGKWIGLNKGLDDQPVGIFKFQTSVDLTDFDPTTVAATVSLTADDRVTDVIINGVSTGMTSKAQNGTQVPPTALPAKLWRAGENSVVVVVQNDPLNAPIANFMTLKVSWAATAVPTVRR